MLITDAFFRLQFHQVESRPSHPMRLAWGISPPDGKALEERIADNKQMGSTGQEQVFFSIDFGTINSAIAMLQPGKEVQLALFFSRGSDAGVQVCALF